ncbi:SDR family NAD(P)-dependent oxidoreductase [Gemmatimonas sp.]|uniref:SDR family NAD(P)-dependent oxidoreductase n=1 Tax=Gemmatimonas sp. TaxID=1962908 RepID=UPI0037BE3FD0
MSGQSGDPQHATPTISHAVVLGGAGEVGEGIVRTLAASGVQVLVPTRSAERAAELARSMAAAATVHVIVADIGTVEGAEAARAAARRLSGPLDLVVASLGGWWQGADLVEVDPETWADIVQNGLTAHFTAARTFLPLLRRGGSYTMVNGAGALRPVPKAGPVTIVAAAQLAMKDVLAAEQRAHGVRVNTVLLATPVRTRSRPTGPADWLTAEDAGHVILRLAARDAGSGETITLAGHAEAAAFR